MFVSYINLSALQALIFLSYLTVLKSDYSEPAPVTGSVQEHLVLVPLVTVQLCMATRVPVSSTSVLEMGICSYNEQPHMGPVTAGLEPS